MTVAQLCQTMTQEELVGWAAFFELKSEAEEKAIQNAKVSNRAQKISRSHWDACFVGTILCGGSKLTGNHSYKVRPIFNVERCRANNVQHSWGSAIGIRVIAGINRGQPVNHRFADR